MASETSHRLRVRTTSSKPSRNMLMRKVALPLQLAYRLKPGMAIVHLALMH